LRKALRSVSVGVESPGSCTLAVAVRPGEEGVPPPHTALATDEIPEDYRPTKLLGAWAVSSPDCRHHPGTDPLRLIPSERRESVNANSFGNAASYRRNKLAPTADSNMCRLAMAA